MASPRHVPEVQHRLKTRRQTQRTKPLSQVSKVILSISPELVYLVLLDRCLGPEDFESSKSQSSWKMVERPRVLDPTRVLSTLDGRGDLKPPGKKVITLTTGSFQKDRETPKKINRKKKTGILMFKSFIPFYTSFILVSIRMIRLVRMISLIWRIPKRKRKQ